ncbi:MAG: 30S ribosomal protein S12 methylthiotransferase RimO [Deltaproteobacteria bacterium]|nr:30S ribosomal protein S12 methylthiotransferase RimO [Deltaproteobacteria bacterium]
MSTLISSSSNASHSPQGARQVHLVSLGCPKNRVDSEGIVGQLQRDGWTLTGDPAAADLLIVNTCAFIEDSKTESIDAILGLADHKAARPGSKLVVAGCLAQRHAADLARELPEVDAFVGTGEYDQLSRRLGLDGGSPTLVHGERKGRPDYLADHLEPRYVAPATFSAYLKIAEGCDQACSFCIIPKLRGAQRSRTVEDCVAEARALVDRGVLEVNLVAQDLTHYGMDRADPRALTRLVRELGRVDGLRWVRLMYAYPDNFGDDLVDAIAETDNCCKYIDMPLQHASDAVLTAMKRRTTRADIEALLQRLRDRIAGVVLRTTMLVGHPGETEADFAQLLEFVKTWRFDRLGCFAYSREDGTLSGRMAGQVPTAVKKARRDRITRAQQNISEAILQGYVGQCVEVLVEGLSEETELLLQGRMRGQAPDIDGVVYINDAPPDIGRAQIRRVLVTQAGAHDLVGEVVA